ncbi:hypothetical protein PENTCL1PPCAC_3021, partial [Pristionchus entomophagus]
SDWMSSRFAGGLPSTGGRNNRKVATIPQPPILMLEKLPSQNLELSQIIHRDAAIVEQGYTKVMLRGVPRFLIDAFDRILKEGKTMEGLFRKEGNAARMKNSQDVYYCKESVTAVGNQWTVHDVCSLVKRFLRDLKTPLITSEIKTRIYEYAKKYPDGVIEPHKLTILFEPAFSDKGIIHPMPAEHIGTLGFIMRQLNELSKDSSVHHMDIQNLATVFAPTIFRDPTSAMDPTKTPKAAHGKTSLMMQKSLEENDLRITAMKVLIKNAQWIGVPSNFYLASRKESCSSASSTASTASSNVAGSCSPSHPNWSRANSLRPSVYGAAGLASLPIHNYSKAEKGGSVSGRKLEKRHSVKTTIASRGRQEEKQDKDRRRSNSTFRDVFTRIGERVRRKSGERNSPSRHMSPPSAGSRGKGGGGGSARGRSPAKKILLEINDHTVSALAAPLDHYEEVRNAVATSRPSLASSSFLQSLPVKSPKLHGRCVQQPSAAPAAAAATTTQQQPARPPPPTPRASTATIERVNSGEKKKGRTIERVCSGEKKKASPSEGRRRVSAASAAAAVPTTQPLQRRSITAVRDEPNSILGDEFFNPTHKFPKDRVRRHTAPIKTGLALRRNQPNTVHSGLKGPVMRRALTMAAADDKENARALIRVLARRRGEEEDMDVDEWGDEEDDTLTDTNRTMTGGIAVVYPSETILEMNHMESRARRNNYKIRRSGEGERGERGGSGRGSATASKLILTPIKDTACAAAPGKSSKSPAPPPLPLCSPPSSAERANSRRRSGKRSVGGEEKSEERRREEEDVEMMPPPLSAPPIPCPRFSLSGSSPHFAIPSLPAGRASSVSSSSAFTTPSTSRRPIGTTPLAAKTPVAANSPLGRRGSSASALDSPQFKAPSSFSSRRQMSVGEKDFAFSDRNRAAILDASDSAELNSNSKDGTRPSVALLRNKNKGMVAARVNLFAAIQSTSDAENASMRSSLGSRHSLTGLDDTFQSTATVRGGPPVGHSIMSSGGSSSSNSSKRSSIASHR